MDERSGNSLLREASSTRARFFGWQMSSAEIYESMVTDVCTLDRGTMIRRLLTFNDGVQLDFSAEYLEGCETERVRHLLVAAMWRSQMRRITAAL